MPGPYRGAVARVHSEAVIDVASQKIDQPTVDKMLAAGIKSLTGAKADREAWASFFSSSDVVGIKVNCSGAPVIRASPEIISGIVRNLTSVGVKPENIYIYERFLDQLTSVHYERFVPAGVQIVAVETPRASMLGYDPKTYVECSFFGEDDTRSEPRTARHGAFYENHQRPERQGASGLGRHRLPQKILPTAIF